MITATRRQRIEEGRRRLQVLQAQRLIEERRLTQIQTTQIQTYAIADGSGLVKIGVARDVEARLKGLQTGNPRTLALVGVLNGNHERPLHRRFKDDHVRGEWFRDTEAVRTIFRCAEADL